MQAIILFSGDFTPASAIAHALAERTGYPLVTDQQLTARSAEQLDISPARFERALLGQSGQWGLVRRPKHRAAVVAAVRETMAAMLAQRPAIFCGMLGLLLPHRLAMRVMANVTIDTRLAIALKSLGGPEATALSRIQAADNRLYAFTHYLRRRGMGEGCGEDLVFQADQMDTAAAVERIVSHMAKQAERAPENLDAMRQDFVLSASVERYLAGKGYVVQAHVQDRELTLTLDQPTLFLSHTMAKIKRLCAPVVGEQVVRIRVGRGFYRADICHKFDFKVSPRLVYKREKRWLARQCVGAQPALPASPEKRPDLFPGNWA